MVKKSEKGGKKKAAAVAAVAAAAVNRGAWTAEEDQKLKDYVKVHGDKKWRALPAKAGLNRCGKSCRLRWLNYLRPGIKRGNISEDEEDLIIRLHNLLGNKWSLIAGRLPGRTDNEVKNHWNTHLSKRSLSIHDLNHKLNRKVEGGSSSGDRDDRLLDQPAAVTGLNVNNSVDVQEPPPRPEFGVSNSPPKVEEEFDIDQLLGLGDEGSKLGLEDYGVAAGAPGDWLEVLLDGVDFNGGSGGVGWTGAAHVNSAFDGLDVAGFLDMDYDDYLLFLPN